MNSLSVILVIELTMRDNVKWWQRNIACQEFCINGNNNHYPNIVIITHKKNIIFEETKGEHLKNDKSGQKVRLDRAWQNKAGARYQYYNVFWDTDALTEGVYRMTQFSIIWRFCKVCQIAILLVFFPRGCAGKANNGSDKPRRRRDRLRQQSGDWGDPNQRSASTIFLKRISRIIAGRRYRNIPLSSIKMKDNKNSLRFCGCFLTLLIITW